MLVAGSCRVTKEGPNGYREPRSLVTKLPGGLEHRCRLFPQGEERLCVRRVFRRYFRNFINYEFVTNSILLYNYREKRYDVVRQCILKRILFPNNLYVLPLNETIVAEVLVSIRIDVTDHSVQSTNACKSFSFFSSRLNEIHFLDRRQQHNTNSKNPVTRGTVPLLIRRRSKIFFVYK